MLFDAQLKQLFEENSVIAIVGAKDKAGSPVEHVGSCAPRRMGTSNLQILAGIAKSA